MEKENWEIEFDKKFEKYSAKCISQIDDKIKDFIKKLLQKNTKEMANLANKNEKLLKKWR